MATWPFYCAFGRWRVTFVSSRILPTSNLTDRPDDLYVTGDMSAASVAPPLLVGVSAPV